MAVDALGCSQKRAYLGTATFIHEVQDLALNLHMSSSSPVFDKAEDDLFGAGISKADANTLCFKLELANGPEQHNCTPNELMIRVVQLVSREVSLSDGVKECIQSVELVDTLLDLLLVRAKSQRLLPPILFRGKLLNEAQSLIISLLVQLLDDVGR